jgi:effector-binding domain-containing protein
MNEITVVDVPPQLVLGVRRRGKYELIGKMIGEVCRYAVDNDIQIQDMPTFICHEMTIEEVMKANEEGNADIEIAVPVAERVAGTDAIKCYELPGGRMAKIIHRGAYEDCEPTYRKLFAWIAENKKKPAGPIREVYLNDPSEVSQEGLLTEIYAPID